MLPPESIRFFHVDPAWVDCLADGAFSIGRVASSDHEADQLLGEDSPAVASGSMITGFLLRSEVVAGWPGLLADGFFDDDGLEAHRLTRLRIDRLAPGVLLCLFAGDREVARVDIYTKPETLHFGFSHDDPELGLYKKLRDQQGRIIDTKVSLGETHWDSSRQRTINVVAWGKTISGKLSPVPSLTSSLFGLQMVESGDKIIFSNKSI